LGGAVPGSSSGTSPTTSTMGAGGLGDGDRRLPVAAGRLGGGDRRLPVGTGGLGGRDCRLPVAARGLGCRALKPTLFRAKRPFLRPPNSFEKRLSIHISRNLTSVTQTLDF
jgi:hypothetical protein